VNTRSQTKDTKLSSNILVSCKAQSRGMRLLLAFNIMLCITIITVPILMPKNDRVAVLTSPWGAATNVMHVISEADGALVNGGKADWIAVASSASENSDDFVDKLYQAGAWLVIDGAIAAACL
jgi:hypothetical protein